MAPTGAENATPSGTSQASASNTSGDADLAQLLSGADPNDPLVQAALAQLQQSSKQQEEEKDPSRKRKKDDA